MVPILEWGRIGTVGGQRMIDYMDAKKDAGATLSELSTQKCCQGYHKRKTLHVIRQKQ